MKVELSDHDTLIVIEALKQSIEETCDGGYSFVASRVIQKLLFASGKNWCNPWSPEDMDELRMRLSNG